MLLSSLLSLISLAPLAVLGGAPGALRSLSGKDYSHHLRRTDEPFPVRLSYTKKGLAGVPKTLMEPAVPVARAGILVASRQLSCDPGYSACSDGAGCCPSAEIMESAAAGCCDQGNTCQTINGATGCCKAGQTCDAFVGCANPSLVECGGDFNFCCPAGETCSRDSQGNAACNGQTATDNGLATGAEEPSQGNTVISIPGVTSSVSSASTTRSSSSQTGSTTATVTRPTSSTATGSSSSSSATSSPNSAFKVVPGQGVAAFFAAIFVWLVSSPTTQPVSY
ncbi:hypothetical protein M408DRAFT_9297 [Serendipita vermifera MAFF 305830]|uniref:GPI anchored protein n=1 Tax=Serendipita vermifera MAFF 305830 TaxID=933852 RepID=A0A0C3B875_SERVB|nr:hypothetical protein M408DRAFT_9297 [Serendipita vermifera MAFF 305830]